MNQVMEVFTWCLDNGLIIYYIQKYLTLKNKERKVSSLIAIVAINAVAMHVLQQFVGHGNLFSLVASLVVITLLCTFIFENPFYQILLLSLVVLVMIGIVEMLSIYLIVLVFDLSVQATSENMVDMFWPIVATKGLTFLIITYLHSLKFNIYRVTRKLSYQLSLLVITNVVLIVVGMSLYQFTTLSDIDVTMFSIIMVAAVILFSALILGVTRKIVEYTELENEWRYKEEGYQEQIKHVKDVDSIFKHLKAQRHEYGNQLQCLYGLIHNNDYDSAQKYLEDLCENIVDVDVVVSTSNPILTSLLNVKHKLATSKHIAMEFQVAQLDLERVEFIDLTIIIGNILDNAIEACEKLKQGEGKIELKVYHKAQNLCIVAINNKTPGFKYQNTGGYTSKEEKEHHGIGLSNVRHVVDKYNGYMKVEDKGNKFVLQIALPNDN